MPEIEYEWDEQRYRFLRAEHRELFKADPLRYAPQFAKFCAMALTRGELDEADPENWLISDGKLYIFGKLRRLGPACSSRTLLETSPKRTRTAPSFKNISGHADGGRPASAA